MVHDVDMAMARQTLCLGSTFMMCMSSPRECMGSGAVADGKRWGRMVGMCRGTRHVIWGCFPSPREPLIASDTFCGMLLEVAQTQELNLWQFVWHSMGS